jgi:hypothetical protein
MIAKQDLIDAAAPHVPSTARAARARAHLRRHLRRHHPAPATMCCSRCGFKAFCRYFLCCPSPRSTPEPKTLKQPQLKRYSSSNPIYLLNMIIPDRQGSAHSNLPSAQAAVSCDGSARLQRGLTFTISSTSSALVCVCVCACVRLCV